jgi:hypothetical protein
VIKAIAVRQRAREAGSTPAPATIQPDRSGGEGA